MRSKNTILTEEIGCARWSLDQSVGLVTTLVFIMAVSEVAPARLLLVVLGEVLAGGVSMALGGYLAARTAKQILDQRIAIERYEIEDEPEEERAELVAIYQHKGYLRRETRWRRAVYAKNLAGRIPEKCERENTNQAARHGKQGKEPFTDGKISR